MSKKTGLIDTNKKSEQIQIELLRKASVSKRFSLVRSLSASVIQLSKRGIKRANPNLSQQDLDIMFIRISYGDELSQKYKLYIEKNNCV